MCSITASAPSRAGAEADHVDPRGAGSGDVRRCVADGHGLLGRPVACSLPRDADQLGAVLGLAPEGALASGEEVIEADDLHPRSSHRLGVSRQERAMLDLAIASAAPSAARHSLVSVWDSSSR